MQPLLKEATNLDSELVQMMLTRGAVIPPTFLHSMIFNGRIPIAMALLEKVTNVDEMDYKEWTPLHFAASKGETEMVEMLLKKGANIEAKTMREGESALFLAVREGHEETVTLLINNGANIDVESNFHSSPLGVSLHSPSHENITLILLDAGAEYRKVKKENRGNDSPSFGCKGREGESCEEDIGEDGKDEEGRFE